MESQQVVIGDFDLSIKETHAVATRGSTVSLAPAIRQQVKRGRQVLERILNNSDQPVYGVNTGFGELVERRISPDQQKQLQRNLIHSHCAGIGDPCSEEVVRAAMLLRINSLADGHSGIRLKVLDLLVDMLNSKVFPYVPEQGSLGASGDLAPLAHIAAVMIGDGQAYLEDELVSGEEALAQVGLSPVQLRQKEGLALINGTQVMAGIASLAVNKARHLVQVADLAGALTAAALGSNYQQFDSRIQNLRPHPGQKESASLLRRLLQYDREKGDYQRVQDAYSIRCIPQVHGSSRQALAHTADVLTTEINSVTDNPLLFSNPDMVISGGNFHGQPLASAIDYLKLGLSTLGSVSERRINRLLHPKLNGNLPPFLATNPGLDSGLMIPHYTIASLVSENKDLCTPSSVDSIPVSGDQEDHVSMGLNSARNLRQVVRNLEYILAGELLAGCRAREVQAEPLPDPLEKAYKRVEEVTGDISGKEKMNSRLNEVRGLIDRRGLLPILSNL